MSEQEEGCMMLRKFWQNSKYELILLKSVWLNEYWLFLGNTDFRGIEISAQNTLEFYTVMWTVTLDLHSSGIRWQILWVDFTIWWGWVFDLFFVMEKLKLVDNTDAGTNSLMLVLNTLNTMQWDHAYYSVGRRYWFTQKKVFCRYSIAVLGNFSWSLFKGKFHLKKLNRIPTENSYY